MVLGVGDAVRAAVFDAYFEGGRDIGRVDVLVEIASFAGLDRTETKAVLDVDRHEADVTAKRLEAQALGVTDVPALSVDGRLVEGFPDLTGLGTLLPDL
jgi:predicted DsbA family dithiol-disulfide isomerase